MKCCFNYTGVFYKISPVGSIQKTKAVNAVTYRYLCGSLVLVFKLNEFIAR